jgi:CBS domain-containing protein
METSGGSSGRVSLEEVIEKTVGEVMIRAPKTLPGAATVGDVRRGFERSSVRTVLLTEGHRFVGAIERAGLPADAPDSAAASGYVELQPLLATPRMPISEAIKLLEGRGEPRLIIVDEDGFTLRGLLCASGGATGFCVR